MSGSRTNHSFEPVIYSELVESFLRIRLKLWNSLRLDQNRSKLLTQNRCLTVTLTGNELKYYRIWFYDDWIIQCSSSSSSHWTEEIIRLGDRWTADMCMCKSISWMKSPNYGFSWCKKVSKFIHFICFRHVKHPFHIIVYVMSLCDYIK